MRGNVSIYMCLIIDSIFFFFRYPAEDFPVLAFTNAPAAFPVEERNWRLHQYVTWSPQIEQLTTEYVRTHMADGISLGIHLRLGSDWVSLYLCVTIRSGLTLVNKYLDRHTAVHCSAKPKDSNHLLVTSFFPRRYKRFERFAD